jgi:hypothetical protein
MGKWIERVLALLSLLILGFASYQTVALHEGWKQLGVFVTLAAVLALIWGLKEYERARGR